MASDGNEYSRLAKRVRGLQERTIDDVPEGDGLTAHQNARPNAPEPVPRGEALRGGRED